MNVLVTGQRAFGAQVLEAVVGAGHSAAACSPELRADGDKWDRLRSAAWRLGLPWMPADALSADTVPAGTDVILAAHSHAFVGRKTRSRVDYAIGYHPSLLPLHRGRDAVRWAVLMGDRVTGGSVYHLTDNVDAGPIALQEPVIVPPRSSAERLWRDLLAPLGVRLLLDALVQIADGAIEYHPQDESLATWEPSWERPPLHRPELYALPSGGV